MAEIKNVTDAESLIDADYFYQLIGKFSVEFEEICYQMEKCAEGVLEASGLKNNSMRQIVLAGLTADPLQRMLRALLAEHFQDKRYEKVLAKSFSSFANLTKKRNSILHGKWIAPIDKKHSDPSTHVLSRRLKTSKNGDDTEYLKYSEVDFKLVIDECIRLQDVFSFLNFLCAFPDRIGDYFNPETGMKCA